MDNKTCINCERDTNVVPLLSFDFQGQVLAICPQCLPVLIHKTHELAAKLPGLANLPPAPHSH